MRVHVPAACLCCRCTNAKLRQEQPRQAYWAPGTLCSAAQQLHSCRHILYAPTRHTPALRPCFLCSCCRRRLTQQQPQWWAACCGWSTCMTWRLTCPQRCACPSSGGCIAGAPYCVPSTAVLCSALMSSAVRVPFFRFVHCRGVVLCTCTANPIRHSAVRALSSARALLQVRVLRCRAVHCRAVYCSTLCYNTALWFLPALLSHALRIVHGDGHELLFNSLLPCVLFMSLYLCLRCCLVRAGTCTAASSCCSTA